MSQPEKIVRLVSAEDRLFECLASQAGREISRLERKYSTAWVAVDDGMSEGEIEAALHARTMKRNANVDRRLARRRAAVAAYFAEEARISALASAAIEAGDMATFAVHHEARLALRDANRALIGGK